MYTNKDKNLLFRDLTYKIIGFVMEIHTELGFGFLEKVYENSLMLLLKKEKIKAVQQKQIEVKFRNEIVGNYIADILVGDNIILEIKSIEKIIDVHISQALNYLKATNLRLALILNFAKNKLEYKRIIR